jgi:hypothetical protein
MKAGGAKSLILIKNQRSKNNHLLRSVLHSLGSTNQDSMIMAAAPGPSLHSLTQMLNTYYQSL